MDVIGVGLGRTGTASLKVALERLGLGPCYHMMEVLDRPDRVAHWRAIAETGRADWQATFAGYRSTVDWPGVGYWRELVDAYPAAKVVLTVRDPNRWYESSLNTIFKFPIGRRGLAQRLAFAMVARLNPSAAEVPRMLEKVMWDRSFDGRMIGGRRGDRQLAVDFFHRHVDQVKAYVAPERLLVFDVAEGWRPLCGFLGLDVPAEPFPRINDAKAFNRMLAARRRAALLPWLTPRPWQPEHGDSPLPADGPRERRA
jgi:hypothetical protein